jgi:hypothetical protein
VFEREGGGRAEEEGEEGRREREGEGEEGGGREGGREGGWVGGREGGREGGSMRGLRCESHRKGWGVGRGERERPVWDYPHFCQ